MYIAAGCIQKIVIYTAAVKEPNRLYTLLPGVYIKLLLTWQPSKSQLGYKHCCRVYIHAIVNYTAAVQEPTIHIAAMFPDAIISFHIVLHMSHVVRNPAFCICGNKDADQLCGYREADQRLCFRYTDSSDQRFVFAIRIVQSLYYLHPKLQASSHLLWLYRLVCVGPGRKLRRPVFSQRGS